MREIKFRAWSKELKKMFYVPVWYFSLNVVGLGIGEEATEAGTSNVEVMQFTGLKDKNGKVIYEGDILKHNSGRPNTGWVEWMGFNPHKTWIGTFIIWDCLPAAFRDECQTMPAYDIEIIGNIWETPELLTQPSTPLPTNEKEV